MAKFVLAALFGLVAVVSGQEQARPATPEKIEPPRDVRAVRVSIAGGDVSLLELTQKLVTAYGLDGSVLHFKDVHLPIDGLPGMVSVVALRAVLRGAGSVRYSKDGQSLVIELDRLAERRVRRKAKDRVLKLLSKWTGEDLLTHQYRIELPPVVANNEPIVLLIHGLDSSPRRLADLRRYLDSCELPVGVFAYPNDETIETTAVALAKRLRDLRPAGHPFYLVGFSMGGLIARYLIETPNLDPGNVELLVQVGTPNHGSRLSRVRFLLDYAEVVRGKLKKPAWLATTRDGLGEAGWDLRPGSPVLERLDRYGRNPNVEYHVILGTRGIVSEAELDALRKRILASDESVVKSLLRPGIDNVLGDLDEIVVGKGDGAVAVKRGRLAGVEPVLVARRHFDLLRGGRENPVLREIASIIERRRYRYR